MKGFWVKNNSFIIQSNMNEIFLNKNYTDLIKGLAMLSIVIGHIVQMLIPSNFLFYKQLLFFLCQINIIFVGCFFFFSGYGNYLSVKKIDSIQGKLLKIFSKIYRIYFVFGGALILYILLYSLFHSGYSFVNISNFFYFISTITIPGLTMWYLKVQVFLYLLFMISVLFFKYSDLISFVFVVISIILAIFFKIPPLWWQTILCFPLGIFVAHHLSLFKKNSIPKIKIIIVLLVIFSVLLFFSPNTISRIIMALSGTSLVVLISYFSSPKNAVLEFLGKNSIQLYIYHWVFISIVRFLDIHVIFKIIFVIIGISIILLYHHIKKILFRT